MVALVHVLHGVKGADVSAIQPGLLVQALGAVGHVTSDRLKTPGWKCGGR